MNRLSPWNRALQMLTIAAALLGLGWALWSWPAAPAAAAPLAQRATVVPTRGPAPTAIPASTAVPASTAQPQPPHPTAVPTPAGGQALTSAGGTFTCASWSVAVPANTVPDNGTVHCGAFDPNVAPAAPSGYQLLNHTINVNLYNSWGSWVTTFAAPLTFCFPYTAADLAAAGNDPSRLTVQTAPIGGNWTALTTAVNVTSQQVCATVNHLTLFDLSVRGGGESVFTVDSPASTITGGTYVIQWGDTLYQLARRFNTTVAALKAANGLTSDLIYAGNVLAIPTSGYAAPVPITVPAAAPAANPRTYTVQAGDNLFRIGLRFGVTVGALQAANGLPSIFIYAGQGLVIP